MRTFNVVTVRYPIGHKTESEGMRNSNNEATNSSIRSAHRGGAFVLRVDGGTKFLSDGTDMTVLRALAIRDDGAIIKNNPLE